MTSKDTRVRAPSPALHVLHFFIEKIKSTAWVIDVQKGLVLKSERRNRMHLLGKLNFDTVWVLLSYRAVLGLI